MSQSTTMPSLVVIGQQIKEKQRGGGAQSAPSLYGSKRPSLNRVKQMSSSSFHMFIYARSEQCDFCPIYTITNTQHIRIYPGVLKFILVKISPDPGRLHGKHAKENQTLFTFLITENLSGQPTPLFTRVKIRSVFRFVQLCCKFTQVNAFTP